jgi:hypothetical protein
LAFVAGMFSRPRAGVVIAFGATRAHWFLAINFAPFDKTRVRPKTPPTKLREQKKNLLK